MHDGSCIGINYAHRFSKCFRSLSHIVGIFALCFVSSIQLLSAVPIYSISDLFANFLWRFTLRKRVFWGVVFTLPVGCSRPPSVVNGPMQQNREQKKSWKSHVWGFIQRRQTTGVTVLSCRFARNLICGLSSELWAAPWVSPLPHTGGRTWWLVPVLFFSRVALARVSALQILGVDGFFCGQRIVEVRTISRWSGVSRLVERNPPILFVSKIFCLRHMMREIFFRKLVHLDTDLFSSIMFELRCTKFGTVQKEIVDPLKTPLDASLFQIMGNMTFSLLWSFPISVAMR